MDVLYGQMTQTVLETLQKEGILLSRVPAGMTHIYQVFGLTVTTLEGEKIIALKNGETGLEPLDSFAAIDRDLSHAESFIR